MGICVQDIPKPNPDPDACFPPLRHYCGVPHMTHAESLLLMCLSLNITRLFRRTLLLILLLYIMCGLVVMLREQSRLVCVVLSDSEIIARLRGSGVMTSLD